MWIFTSLLEKELELVCKMKSCGVDIVCLRSTHRTGSGTKCLNQGWSLFYSRVPTGDGSQSGVGILIVPRMKASQLEFFPRWTTGLPIWGFEFGVFSLLGEGGAGCQEGKAPLIHSIVLLEDTNYLRNGGDTWRGVIGRNGLLDMNPSGEMLLYFCSG